MKIDRTNPAHWLYLTLFGVNVILATLLRPLFRGNTGHVVLYGHKLNGNLRAIYGHLSRPGTSTIQATFLTMDPSYYRRLCAEGVSCDLAISPRCIPLLACAEAVISDHGLHVLVLMLKLTSIRFFDVWHGIPFKGFDAADFRVLHDYDEIWVASPLLERLYVEKFGFHASQVNVTGYARTDILVSRRESLDEIRSRKGLGRLAGKKVILYAPTWKQDSRQRSVYPFGADERAFFGGLLEVCQKTDAVVLFRTHLNSDEVPAARGERVIHVPHAEFPDTEQLLLLSDVLVCDWSSIAFDYLLLDRPTIFLDVEAPFSKGFSLGPEYRFGAIARSTRDLLAQLEQYLLKPGLYRERFAGTHAAIKRQVYDDYADGRSAERCARRLEHWFAKSESFQSPP